MVVRKAEPIRWHKRLKIHRHDYLYGLTRFVLLCLATGAVVMAYKLMWRIING